METRWKDRLIFALLLQLFSVKIEEIDELNVEIWYKLYNVYWYQSILHITLSVNDMWEFRDPPLLAQKEGQDFVLINAVLIYQLYYVFRVT